mgnify:CR=1 FL=1
MRNIYRRFYAYEFSLVNYVTPKNLHIVTLLAAYTIGLDVFYHMGYHINGRISLVEPHTYLKLLYGMRNMTRRHMNLVL